MSSIVFPVARLGITIPGAPIIAAAPVFPYYPEPILGANDWNFGPDSASLVPFGGTATLTAQDGPALTWGAHSVTIPAYTKALVSNIDETESMTMWAVFRYIKSGSKNAIVFGNVAATSVGGFAVTNGFGGNLNWACYGPSPITGNIAATSLPAGLSEGDLIFAAVSFAPDGAGGTRVRTKLSGSAAIEVTRSSARLLVANKLAFGNAFLNNANYTPVNLELGGGGHIPAETTLAGLETIYSEIKRRFAEFGLDLK